MDHLNSFLLNPLNSVTREKIFYNKLYYDLKLAAARRGYALTLYEPEVDRDGFDIVLDDADVTRFIQLKTVLKTSKTSIWQTSKRFLRPTYQFAEGHALSPDQSGKGGAVVLIEIDTTLPEPAVTYRVTDFSLMMILSMVIGKTNDPHSARPLGPRGELAGRTWQQVLQGSPRDKITVSKSSFLKARDADGLLALLGLHSNSPCYQPATSIMLADQQGFRIQPDGTISRHQDVGALALGKSCAENLLTTVDEPKLFVHPHLTWIGQGQLS